MNKRSNAVVPHDDDEEEEFDSDSNEQLIVRDDNVYANISDDDSDSDDDDYDYDKLMELANMSFFSYLFSACKPKIAQPDPLKRKYHQLKEKNTDLLLTLRIVEPWTWDFFDIFIDMDEDGGGEIEVEEFHDFYNLEPTAFSKRIFAEFDLDESGGLSYAEFIAAIWNYCSSTSDDLLKFAFDMYDLDGNGTLAPEECASLLRMIFAKEDLDDRLKRIIVEMDADGDGEVDFGELVDYVEEHPYMIEPMISMRTILRNSVCGARYWREATEWRQRQFGPHADMSKVITYKKDLEVKETAYEAKNKTINEAKEDARRNIEERRKEWKMKLVCRKASGAEWLQWLRGHCSMIILQREAERISEDNNVEAAQLRQQWLSLERQVNFAFKDLEKLWIQQKTRLVEKHVEEQTNEIEKRFETKKWKSEVKIMIKELVELRKGQETMMSGGAFSKENAQKMIEAKLVKQAKEKALKLAEEEFKTQYKAFEEDNKSMLNILRTLPDERVRKLRDKNREAWTRLVSREIMELMPKDPTMSFLEFGSDKSTQHDAERVEMERMLKQVGGFRGVESSSQEKHELQIQTKKENLPFCPTCDTKGSSETSKFCPMCGTSMFRSRWDNDFDCVVYECMKTGLSQLDDPRTKNEDSGGGGEGGGEESKSVTALEEHKTEL